MITVQSGAILLLLTALVHAFKGFPRLQNAITNGKISVPRFNKNAKSIISEDELKFSWLAFSSHLFIVAFLTLYISWSNPENQKVLLVSFAIIPIIDAIILKIFTKELHLGIPLLFISGVLILFGILVT